ncbi:MAG: hypothetical protein LC104_11860 [Bacteroidales bacterium]|nr:hypothetical protein [Bacteroidales bacterium]
MPTYLTVKIDDVFTNIGMVRSDCSAGTALRPQRPFDRVTSYGVLLYWPKLENWFRLEGDFPGPVGQPRAQFLSTREGVETICRVHGMDTNRVAPAGLLAAMEFRVASLTASTAVNFSVFVDSNHDRFRALAREQGLAKGITETHQPRQILFPVKVLLFDTKSLGAVFTQSGELEIQLEPACPVPAFYGVAALDLGNTATAMVCLSRRDAIYRTESLRLLDADTPRPTLRSDASPLVSNVRIDRVVSQLPSPKGIRRFPSLELNDDDPRAIEFYAGRTGDVHSSFSPGLILGPKRLVSGTESDNFREITARLVRGDDSPENDERILLQNRVPAELLACRMLEKFRTASRSWPGELVVTYPTTFTPREIDRLCQAVERGWLRMNNQPQRSGITTPPDDMALAELVSATQARLQLGGSDDAAPGAIRMRLDEATAAAFFFLFRRVFESPGGLQRFRYLHPQGLNLLLYDLGGGTTDIALVRATSDHNRHLRVGVLGRTGMRGFGGDDMTRIVARLLKGKLLMELLRARGKTPPAAPTRNPDPAAARAAIEQWLRKLADLDPNDLFVPTRFTPGSVDPDSRMRQRCAIELFRFAETLKRELAQGGGKDGGSAKFSEGIVKNRDTLFDPLFKGIPDVQVAALQAQLHNLTLHRWEVDALLDGPNPSAGFGSAREGLITRSIQKCNGLIDEVLRRRPAEHGQPEEEVDWVVISGNAARYPLVREQLIAKLEIDNVKERLTLDEDNLKFAVAKGAAIFLMTTRTPGLQVVIETATDLSACLPFDVGFYDLSQGQHINLYREQDRYVDLRPKPVPVHVMGHGDGNEKRSFFLERRFPGDEAYSQFLAFDFDQPPGALEVSYDVGTHEFRVSDSATGMPGTPRDLTEGMTYLTPPERGDV